MASMNEPSKTLFDTSKPPDGPRPIILLDQTFSSARIAAFLRTSSDWQVVLHGDHFSDPSMPDHEWIADCGRRGWLSISCDKAIRRSPLVVEAVKRTRAKVFFMTSGGLRAEDYMAILGVARPRILRLAKKNAGPFFARIHRSGKVERVGFAEGETARQKTARKYRSGSAYHQFDGEQQSGRRRRRSRRPR